MVVKFVFAPDHLGHLTMAFEQMGKHKLKMNAPLKCRFTIS